MSKSNSLFFLSIITESIGSQNYYHMWSTCVLRFSQFQLMTARMAVKAASNCTPFVSLNLTNRSLYSSLLYECTRILTLPDLNHRPGAFYGYSETSPNATLPFWLIWRIAYLTIEVSLSRWDCTSIATRFGREKNSIVAIQLADVCCAP